MHTMSKGRFSHLEDRLERLIEGSFTRLFRGSLSPRDVALALARAIEDHVALDETGVETAPNRYHISLNPADHNALLSRAPDLAEQLARQVVVYCQEAGLSLAQHPEISLSADEQIEPQQLRVEASHNLAQHEATQILQPLEPQPPTTPRRPAEPQLIVDGSRSVPLTRDIFNVGRRPDNDLVLDDPRVSRHHLQLRLRYGRYVLYDAQSRGGTYVNGQRTTEHILAPGDVIQIGGTSLLYMEEDPTGMHGDTQSDMHPPPTSDDEPSYE
jgi:hypothetical protein